MFARLRESKDDGITLVELLIYILLATIVGTIVASILINSLRVQVQIQDAAASSQGTFLVAEAIGTAARDSTAMTTTTLPDGTIIVRTRSLDPSVESTTTFGPDSFLCYAFSASGGEIRFTTSDAAISVANVDEIAAWTLIADGVQTVGPDPVMGTRDGGREIRLALVTELGDGGPQQLTTTIRSLQPDEPANEAGIVRVSEPCF
jgi:hypothetical protein